DHPAVSTVSCNVDVQHARPGALPAARCAPHPGAAGPQPALRIRHLPCRTLRFYKPGTADRPAAFAYQRTRAAPAALARGGLAARPPQLAHSLAALCAGPAIKRFSGARP